MYLFDIKFTHFETNINGKILFYAAAEQNYIKNGFFNGRELKNGIIYYDYIKQIYFSINLTYDGTIRH